MTGKPAIIVEDHFALVWSTGASSNLTTMAKTDSSGSASGRRAPRPEDCKCNDLRPSWNFGAARFDQMKLTGLYILQNHRPLRFSAIMAASLMSGCSDPQPVPENEQQLVDAKISDPLPTAKPVSSLPIREEITETDRLMLESAEKACSAPGGSGYVEFFDAFARSGAVRRKYSAPTIKYVVAERTGGRVEQTLDATNYNSFPIVIVDYYRKPAVPSRTGGREEYVEVQFNQSQSGHFSADWTRVHYVGESEGGDDLGKPVDLDGNPYDPVRRTDGQLLFNSVGDCWQLVADIRNAHEK